MTKSIFQGNLKRILAINQKILIINLGYKKTLENFKCFYLLYFSAKLFKILFSSREICTCETPNILATSP